MFLGRNRVTVGFGGCLSVCLPVWGRSKDTSCRHVVTGTRKRVLGEEGSLEVRSCVTLGWAPSLSQPVSSFSKRGKASWAGSWEKMQVTCVVHSKSSTVVHGL